MQHIRYSQLQPRKGPLLDSRSLLSQIFPTQILPGGGLAANVPFGGTSISAGAAVQRGKQVDVSVSQVETAGLPAPVMRRIVQSFLVDRAASSIINADNIKFFNNFYEDQMITDQGCFLPEQQEFGTPKIVFISKVYYARAFDYDFSQSDAFAATLRAALAVTTEKATSASSTQALSSSTVPPVNAQAAADIAAATLRSLADNSTPGVSSTIQTGSHGGLSLKQTFDRPLAFGVEQTLSYNAGTLINYIDNPSDPLPGAVTHNRIAQNFLAPFQIAASGPVTVPERKDNPITVKPGDCLLDRSIRCSISGPPVTVIRPGTMLRTTPDSYFTAPNPRSSTNGRMTISPN
jgi:hypothetical protein